MQSLYIIVGCHHARGGTQYVHHDKIYTNHKGYWEVHTHVRRKCAIKSCYIQLHDWLEGIVILVIVIAVDIPVSRGKILQRSLGVSLDRLAALGPSNGADFAVLFLHH